MDQVMNVNDWYLFHGVANVIVFNRVVGPRVLGITPDEAAIEAAMPKARAVFEELARLLGDKPFFTGDTVSLQTSMSRRRSASSPRRRSGRCSARRIKTSSRGWRGWKPGRALRRRPGSASRRWRRRRKGLLATTPP
jgi:hypothetical protein